MTVEAEVATLVAVLAVAAAVSVVVRWLPVPYVGALALVGLGLSFVPLPGMLRLHLGLSGPLILFAFLPGLLFEASFNLEWLHLRHDWAPVVVLATLGVGLTTLLAALMGHAALGLGVGVALLFGTMVAPTDPVAVVAVARRLGVPARLLAVIEAESLLNDGTAVVLFSLALVEVSGGASLGSVALQFVRLAPGGVGLGLAIGFLFSWLTSRIDDPRVEITMTVLVAYGGYLLGDALGVSGILCVVCAALVLGNYGRRHGMSQRTREAVHWFWDYVAFLLNTLLFLLIGLSVPVGSMAQAVPVALLGALIAVAARAATVYSVMPLLGRHRLALAEQHLMVWSGLRGAVALALLLGLGPGPARAQLLAPVYGVVLFSTFVQGVTVGPAVRLLPRRRQAAE